MPSRKNQVAPMSCKPVLPNLPGYSNSNSAKPKHKSSGFQMVNGVRMNKQEDSDSDLTQVMTQVEANDKWQTTGRDIGFKSTRADIVEANPDKVYRFYAYFKETVNESNLESHRTRKVTLLFYADGTLEINESKVINSGIPQGCFLKRGAVPPDQLPAPEELKIGDKLTIFGRCFVIFGADDDTFISLSDTIGERSAELEGSAQDQYTEERLEIAKRAGGDTDRNFGKRNSALKSFMEASLGNSMQRGSDTRSERKAQFLQNTGKVLSFKCEFNDTQNLYGDMMYYTLNYYLADDTVEIKEKRTANSGRDPFPLLLKRQKLPVNWMAEGLNDRDRGVELDCGYEVYVTPDNVQVGNQLTVYGRLLKVVDCDAFTRSWYAANPHMLPAGWEEQPPSCAYHPSVESLPTAAPAEYNGYGTEEDSLGSCTHLIPKVPKKDFVKFMNHSTTILRFKAKFVTGTCKQEHASREFIISYFPSDDTQSIFEQGQRNSGIVAGKFLERGAYSSQEGAKYSLEHFFVGAQLYFNSHQFTVYDMDECTKKSGLVKID